jgi:hypothetical protein
MFMGSNPTATLVSNARIGKFKWRIGVYYGRRLRRHDWSKKSASARLSLDRAQVQRSARRAFYEGEIVSMSGVVQRHRPGHRQRVGLGAEQRQHRRLQGLRRGPESTHGRGEPRSGWIGSSADLPSTTSLATRAVRSALSRVPAHSRGRLPKLQVPPRAGLFFQIDQFVMAITALEAPIRYATWHT